VHYPRSTRLVAATAAGLAVAGVVVGVAVTGSLHDRPAASVQRIDSASTTNAANQVRTQPVRSDRSRRSAHVARPRRLITPDALLRLNHRASPGALRRFRRLDGVHATAVLSRGRVYLGGRPVTLVAGDLGTVRPFAPEFTAKSQPLWDSLAGGELTISYSSVKAFRHLLGATLVAHAHDRITMPLRIGAFASLGLGRADGLVDATTGMMLDLKPARELVVSAHQLPMSELRSDARRIFGGHTKVFSQRPKTIHVAAVSAYARATIPPTYLHLYQAAATTCAGLPWTVLAAIGGVETGHGANTHVSSKGAMGPMQFLPGTFAAYAVDGNGDGIADIRNPDDAVYTAARYLCLWGAGRGGQALYDAVFAYNHADWYVRRVFALANAYA
jgi:transglycosylase-like protein with SLT domain